MVTGFGCLPGIAALQATPQPVRTCARRAQKWCLSIGDQKGPLKECRDAGDGLTQAEVTALEESPQRPGGIPPGVQGSGNQWEIIVDFLYRDVLDMMVGLAHDTTQMQQAEARFQAGTYVWRP